MKDNENMTFAKKVIWQFLAVAISVISAFYLARWLEGDISIKYHQSENFLTKIGSVLVDDNLTLEIERITYRDTSFSSLRVVRYLLFNDDARSLQEHARFVFIDRDSGRLDPDAAIDINCATISPSSEIVLWERSDIPGIGPGIALLSDLPGNSRNQVTLVLDTGKYPNISNSEIQMRKVARQGACLTQISPFRRTLTYTVTNFIVWIIMASSIWGTAWLILNIKLRNYSTGCRILDWMLKKVGFKGFIHQDQPK